MTRSGTVEPSPTPPSAASAADFTAGLVLAAADRRRPRPRGRAEHPGPAAGRPGPRDGKRSQTVGQFLDGPGADPARRSPRPRCESGASSAGQDSEDDRRAPRFRRSSAGLRARPAGPAHRLVQGAPRSTATAGRVASARRASHRISQGRRRSGAGGSSRYVDSSATFKASTAAGVAMRPRAWAAAEATSAWFRTEVPGPGGGALRLGTEAQRIDQGHLERRSPRQHSTPHGAGSPADGDGIVRQCPDGGVADQAILLGHERAATPPTHSSRPIRSSCLSSQTRAGAGVSGPSFSAISLQAWAPLRPRDRGPRPSSRLPATSAGPAPGPCPGEAGRTSLSGRSRRPGRGCEQGKRRQGHHPVMHSHFCLSECSGCIGWREIGAQSVHGSRLGRSSQRLASASPTICSATGSHLSGRFSQ